MRLPNPVFKSGNRREKERNVHHRFTESREKDHTTRDIGDTVRFKNPQSKTDESHRYNIVALRREAGKRLRQTHNKGADNEY